MEAELLNGGSTVVVSGVPDVLSACRMADKLIVHFQNRRRSDGGDVRAVRFPAGSSGVAFVTFDSAADAEKVVKKEPQILTDSEFPEEYLLTVFPFSRDVFLYVSSAQVDLSVFAGDQASLIQSLRSAHRSVRFQPQLHQRTATIEGPFAAIRALRQDLVHRALRQDLVHGVRQFEPSAPAAIVKLREPPLDPRATSHHKFSRDSKAKLEPAGLLCVSASGGNQQSFSSTDKGAELKDGTRLRATEQTKVKPREEATVGVRPSLSGPAEGMSVKQPEVGQKQHHSESLDNSDIWVEACVFRYIERFDKKECDRRLRGHAISVRYFEETDLMQISLTEKELSSGIQPVLEDLKALVEYWHSTLRVHNIDYDSKDHQVKQKLMRICSDVNILFADVLYVFEDSCVKFVGPSASSFLFYWRVKDRLKGKML